LPFQKVTASSATRAAFFQYHLRILVSILHIVHLEADSVTMTTNNNMEMTLLPKRSSSGADVSISRTSQDGRTSNDGFDTRVEGKGNVSDFAAPEIQPGHTQPEAFFKLFSLWIGTVILTALVVTIVMVYRAKGILTPAEKDIYNTVSTVLILVLGLSFFVSLSLGLEFSGC